MEAKAQTKKKTYLGRVKSNKMNKTIVVAIETRILHNLYKKYVQYTKTVKAHDEENNANVGDLVRIMESRPLSKDKHWRLTEIVERAK